MSGLGLEKKEEEDEDRKEAKVGASPWDEVFADVEPARRVAGWRDGASLQASEVKDLLRQERWARKEYHNMRKFIKRKKQDEQADPLEGLPPTWQAFWVTVPHLNPQVAFKLHQKDQQRQKKAQELAAADEALGLGDEEVEDEAALLEEVSRLETEVREKKEALADKEREHANLERKLAKVRELDEQEEERSRGTKRKLEAASYTHGVLEGKIRSSDIYFEFLMADTKESHMKKAVTMQRSNALLEKKIHILKGEVRDLLKVAAEAIADHNTRTESFLGSNRDNDSSMHSETHQKTPGSEAASEKADDE